MNCPSCKLENSDSNLICSHCGVPLNSGQKVCSNGHYYDSSLDKCPHCPSAELQGLMGTTKAYDSGNNFGVTSGEGFGKTQMVNPLKTSPSISPANYGNQSKSNQANFDAQKTMIVRSDDSASSNASTPGRKLMGWLVTFTWKQEGEDFKLFEGRNILGSSSEADIKVTDSAVSGKHCMILFRSGKIKIKDELSTNGTFINGAEIEESEIKDGDIIRLGTTELKFRSV